MRGYRELDPPDDITDWAVRQASRLRSSIEHLTEDSKSRRRDVKDRRHYIGILAAPDVSDPLMVEWCEDMDDSGGRSDGWTLKRHMQHDLDMIAHNTKKIKALKARLEALEKALS